MLGIYLLGIALIVVIFRGGMFNKNTQKDKIRLLMLTFVLLAMLMGCRDAQQDYGSDLNNYYRTFERAIQSVSLKNFIADSTMEKGYLYINWILSRIIKWPQFIIFFQAIFCCGMTLRYIYKHSTDVLVSILGFLSLGLFQFYLTGFRQSIAIAICLFAFEMIEKKKIIKFLICVLLAITIHQTAIVYILVYIIASIEINQLSVILDICFVAIVSQSITQLIDLGNEVFDKNYKEQFAGSRFGGMINILIGLMIIFVMLYHIRKNNLDKRKYGVVSRNDSRAVVNYYPNYKMFHVLVLGIGIYAMRYQALVLERISFYFTPTMFILLPEVVENGFSYRSRRILRFLIIVGMLFLICWRF